MSCLDVKETQARIDRLVNGTLLPHTVFFGQHMGAGRGLVDATDRTLKEHLALIFPLDIWKGARGHAREKYTKAQEASVSSEAKLEVEKSIVARLGTSAADVRDRSEEFERTRTSRIASAEGRIRALLAAISRSDEDSIAFAECLPLGSSDLTAMIEDCKRELRLLEDKTVPSPVENGVTDAAADLATATASLTSAEEFLVRVSYLAKKSELWEGDKRRRTADMGAYLESSHRELDHLEKPSVLDEEWSKALDAVRLCDESYQELVNINIREGRATRIEGFEDELLSLHSARQRASVLREERVRLQTTLDEVRLRLNQSDKPSFVSQKHLAPVSSEEGQTKVSSDVACDICLRPFDGELYLKARVRLEEEAASIDIELKESKAKGEDENMHYEQVVKTLNELIDSKRSKILERKNAASEIFSRVRGQRDRRNALIREIQDLARKKELLERESNLYAHELLEISSASRLLEDDPLEVSDIVTNMEANVTNTRANLVEQQRKYEDMIIEVKYREQNRTMSLAKKSTLAEHFDDLQQIRSRCEQLENVKNSLKLETNPFQESMRMVSEELATAQAKLHQRKEDFSILKETVNALKSLDVAFGPRGVPSFVLEEGLVWLEKLTAAYLHKLSAGELMLQIRAFSDYKSSSRSDGDNKEVISKKVFIRKQGSNSQIRERSLRQLSGGQRRRCSLAFALAFADLANERAGFQSSLIVMDEILQALDEDGRQRISKILPTLMGESQAFRDTVIVVAQDEAPEIAGLAHGGIDVVVQENDQSSVLLDGKVPLSSESSS